MSTKLEKLEKSMVKLTIEVSAEKFSEGMKHAYNKNKSKIAIPGFRKGKAPRKLIERAYGPEIFYEDAANFVIPDAYDEAVKEHNLDVVSRPEIDVEQIEEGKSFIFTAEVAIKPEVELGQYKDLEYEKVEINVTDEEVDEELKNLAQKNARKISIEDRPVQDGDELTIDFEGFIDGEAFEGGKAENYNLKIGSHSFIDNFEEQLVGKNIGEEVEVNVTFPENYQQKELANKPALFKVTVKEIKVDELPEINDDFAKDVSDYDTLDEYKKEIKENIQKKKEETAKHEKENKLLEKAVADSKMDIPKAMIDNEVEMMVNQFTNSLKYQGLALDQYLAMTGSNMVTLKENIRPESEKRVKSNLVLETIAKKENIEPSQEEIDAELKNMAEMYNMDVDKIKETIGEYETEQIKQDISMKKALDLIVNHSKEM